MPTVILTLVTPTSLAADPAAWDLIAGIDYAEVETATDWHVRKTFPSELLARSDDFAITGYVMVLTAEPFVQTFLLTQDTSDCPFCGSASHAATALEVTSARPLPDRIDGERVTLRGTLETIEDPQTYQALRLVDARLIE